MNRIINPGINIVEPFRDNKEMMYALKHFHDGVKFQGIWQCDQFRDGKLIAGGYPESPNIFTTEGMARLLNIMFHDISKAASEIWYVGIFKNNVTPALGDTAAAKLGAAGDYGECQDADYDDPATDKPSYTTADTATATITNAVAGKAEFTMADSITVYGAFLSTEKAKTATTGYLMCAKKFSASRAVEDDDQLAVTYAITCSSS
jgi:hypothetical protein